jgi:protein-tyrosine phosphatase
MPVVAQGSLPAPLTEYADLAPGTSLGIGSVPNLRDAGGYATEDGKTVRRGLVYRSNQLAPISDADMAKLAALGLKNDFDLRTEEERKALPDQLPPGVWNVWLDVLADASDASPAKIEALLKQPKDANEKLGDGKIDALFEKAYREFVTLPSARASFRELFVYLSSPSQLPSLYHCTTGKDRTGWASAALLTLLGVPREQVMADFLKSNEYILPHYAKEIEAFTAAGGEKEIVEAILGVKPAYLDAAFDEMEQSFGTIEDYFAEGLGIDAYGQQALRAIFLQER